MKHYAYIVNSYAFLRIFHAFHRLRFGLGDRKLLFLNIIATSCVPCALSEFANSDLWGILGLPSGTWNHDVLGAARRVGLVLAAYSCVAERGNSTARL